MKEIFSGIFFVRKSAKGFLGNSDSRCSLYRVRLVPPIQIFFSTLSTGDFKRIRVAPPVNYDFDSRLLGR